MQNPPKIHFVIPVKTGIVPDCVLEDMKLHIIRIAEKNHMLFKTVSKDKQITTSNRIAPFRDELLEEIQSAKKSGKTTVIMIYGNNATPGERFAWVNILKSLSPLHYDITCMIMQPPEEVGRAAIASRARGLEQKAWKMQNRLDNDANDVTTREMGNGSVDVVNVPMYLKAPYRRFTKNCIEKVLARLTNQNFHGPDGPPHRFAQAPKEAWADDEPAGRVAPCRWDDEPAGRVVPCRWDDEPAGRVVPRMWDDDIGTTSRHPVGHMRPVMNTQMATAITNSVMQRINKSV
jgi:hypothetical protein